MPEYSSPGVYVEEFEIGAKPIEGVSTSTAGFIGMAEKGKTEGLPVFISSMNQFRIEFGEYLPLQYGQYRYLWYAVASFFTNGGSGCYVMRVAPSDAKAGTNNTVPTGIAMSLDQSATKDDTVLHVPSLRGIDTTSEITLISYLADGSEDKKESALKLEKYDAAKGELTLQSAITNDYPKERSLCIVSKLAGGLNASASSLAITASSKGAWGNGIIIEVRPASLAQTPIEKVIGAATTSKQYKLKNKNGFYKGAIVEFDNGTKKQYSRIAAMQDDLVTLSDHLTGDDGVIDPKYVLATCEFSLIVSYGDQQEVFPNLSMNPDVPNYFMTQINNRSAYISASSPYSAASDFTRTDPFDMPTNKTIQDKIVGIRMSQGSDGTVAGMTPSDFIGQDKGPGKRTGIEAFKDIGDVNIMAVPGITDVNVQLALIAHCEKLGDRFAVLDLAENIQSVTDCQAARKIYSSSYAALYHPWIQSFDPLVKQNSYMPPSGAVIGVYARSDKEVGVHKAPANEEIKDATDLKYRLTKEEQGMLNPNGVNLIRVFPGRGIRVWGARTLTDDGLWKYVNVRRLFIYLETSINRATHWVAFEVNDAPLWARVRQTIVQFLTDVWRSGALAGSTAEEAFFVKCDRTTMSPGDIGNGKLICVIGVAPVKPAEFVIFRIAQLTAGAKN